MRTHGVNAATADVWLVHVEDETAVSPSAALLPADERERLSSLAQPHRRRRTCAHAAIRILTSAAALDPSHPWTVTRMPNGQLTVEQHAAPKLHISLSHSGEYAAIALTTIGIIGIDLDTTDPSPQAESDRFARFALAEPEYIQWRQAAPAIRKRLLARAWTRKEAVLKALGTGLSGDVRSVITHLTPTEARVEVIALPPEAGPAQHWTLHDLPVPPGHAGTVAVKAPQARIAYQCRTISDLLETMAPGQRKQGQQ